VLVWPSKENVYKKFSPKGNEIRFPSQARLLVEPPCSYICRRRERLRPNDLDLGKASVAVDWSVLRMESGSRIGISRNNSEFQRSDHTNYSTTRRQKDIGSLRFSVPARANGLRIHPLGLRH